MNIVHIVNKTLEKIDWMHDGKPYFVMPLEKKPFERSVAEHGKKKTRYGLDVESGEWHYRLAIPEDGDNVDPIEPKGHDDPSLWVDQLHKRADLEAEGKVLKKFANPDLAMRANLDD